MNWIKVSERLPDYGVDVVILVYKFKELFVAYRYEYDDLDWDWKNYDGDDILLDRDEITHWCEITYPE